MTSVFAPASSRDNNIFCKSNTSEDIDLMLAEYADNKIRCFNFISGELEDYLDICKNEVTYFENFELVFTYYIKEFKTNILDISTNSTSISGALQGIALLFENINILSDDIIKNIKDLACFIQSDYISNNNLDYRDLLTRILTDNEINPDTRVLKLFMNELYVENGCSLNTLPTIDHMSYGNEEYKYIAVSVISDALEKERTQSNRITSRTHDVLNWLATCFTQLSREHQLMLGPSILQFSDTLDLDSNVNRHQKKNNQVSAENLFNNIGYSLYGKDFENFKIMADTLNTKHIKEYWESCLRKESIPSLDTPFF